MPTFRSLVFAMVVFIGILVSMAVPNPGDFLPLTPEERRELKAKYQQLETWMGGKRQFQTVWRPERIEVRELDLRLDSLPSKNVSAFAVKRGPWVLPKELQIETAAKFRNPLNYHLRGSHTYSTSPQFCLTFLRGQDRVELAVDHRGFAVQLQEQGRFVRNVELRNLFWTALKPKILASAPQ